MLETIRKHQQSWLTYLIFGAIIVVFAFSFGPGSGSCNGTQGPGVAATVDGETIRQQDYEAGYAQQVEMFRRRAQGAGIDWNSDFIEKMGLKEQVIDSLIEKKLLAREAKKRGLTVSDAELLTHLETYYGVKDVTEEQYRNWIENNFRTSVQRFEDDRREELAAQKLQQLINDSVGLSDAELKASYLREHDRAMVEYVRFDPSQHKGDEPKQAEIDALIKDEAAAVEARFNTDQLRYRTPEQRHARQILKNLAPDATDADVARARSQLLEWKGQIEGGADFAALAREHSDDEATKAKGGDLGTFRRGQMVRPLEEAAFKLKKDELTSDPVRSPLGLHLIQVTEVVPPAVKKLDEVKQEVALSILKERAGEAAVKAQSDALLAQLKAGKPLAELTASEDEEKTDKKDDKKKPVALKPVRHESPWLTKGEISLPRIGASKELHDAIFALTAESRVAPQAYKVGRGYFVVVLKEREAPDLAKFESDKESLRDQALWPKRQRVFEDWMKHLREQAKVELNPVLFKSKVAPPAEPSDKG
jgi:peptidyl-prolyl cis-trans isomerase D